MTADQILNEILALSPTERKLLAQRVRQLDADEIPKHFIEALDDFEKERFVSMETVLNETPPDGSAISTARSKSSGEISIG
jgi:hypothetical protein